MPNYSHQRLTTITNEEFFKYLKEARTTREKALLVVLYYWGCRVSEALALKRKDVIIDDRLIFIRFHRLKGSKQVPPVPLDKTKPGISYVIMAYDSALDRLFPFTRLKVWRLCHRFNLYPHFFRMNRISKDSKNGLAYVRRRHGISMRTVDYYLGDVELTGYEEID